jgi:hypothetical protein
MEDLSNRFLNSLLLFIYFMKKIFFLFVLLIPQQNIFSQKKLISGKILDDYNQKGIYNVHVYSAKLGEGTITNADGNFYLIVAKNDELHFSCIGYKKQAIKLSKTFAKSELN